MQELKLIVNESLLSNVEAILEENGLNIQSIVSIVLKRIERENGIDFIFGNTNSFMVKTNDLESAPQFKAKNQNKMTKTIAKRLLSIQSDNVSFSSKNRTANNYWSNPSYDCLNSDWFLILNDWQTNELHLFKIPARSFNRYNLVARADQPHLIDLQIAYKDPTFTDNRSGCSFKKYFVTTIKY